MPRKRGSGSLNCTKCGSVFSRLTAFPVLQRLTVVNAFMYYTKVVIVYEIAIMPVAMSPPLPIDLLHQFFEYNPQTGALVWRAQSCDHCDGWSYWNTRYAGKSALATNQHGYLRGTFQGRTYSRHRIIWAIMTGVWPDNYIDHINGIRSDNRWCNLRDAPQNINMKNKRMYRNNTSGCTGVKREGGSSKWKAEIKHNGTLIRLGTFEDYSSAVRARKDAEARFGFSRRHGVACDKTRYPIR